MQKSAYASSRQSSECSSSSIGQMSGSASSSTAASRSDQAKEERKQALPSQQMLLDVYGMLAYGGRGGGLVRVLPLDQGSIPLRPKLLQKTSLQKEFLEAILFVTLTKTLCIQLEKTRKRPQNITKKSGFRGLFCNNFGQDSILFAPGQRAGAEVLIVDCPVPNLVRLNRELVHNNNIFRTNFAIAHTKLHRESRWGMSCVLFLSLPGCLGVWDLRQSCNSS